MDDTPSAEHTTPPELEKESMKNGKIRGYARKIRAKFSTASISMAGLDNASTAVVTTVEQNNLEENIDDDDMQIMLDMDSEDEEDLDKYLTNIHTNKHTALMDTVGTNLTNSQSGISPKPTSASSVSSASDAKGCTQQPSVKKTPLVSMSSAADSEVGIDHDPSREIKSNVTVDESEQVERLFDSSSDEDMGGDNSNSSSAPSTSDEEDSGDVSDAAEDLPASVTGLNKSGNTEINYPSEQKKC